ncbi:MAG: NAD(P)H-quinone oxidoreductase [Bacteroidetes bacterium]|nr:NAD(P)H-quinone oxidoreductase [Bacteroidota bacterium]
MRAILQTTSGSAETLNIGETPDPVPAPGELLVSVKAFGLNRADIQQREGKYPAPSGVTPILGLELSGVVIKVGEQVKRFKAGDEVFGLVSGGAYAELVCLDERMAIKKPKEMSHETAAAIPEMMMTAWLNLMDLGNIRDHGSVLIHAGASGVGSAAIQLAKHYGCKVFTTVGSAEKADFCRSLGADVVINYKTEPDFKAVVKQYTSGKGVDVILDCIGASYLEGNISSCRQDGKIIMIGLLGGSEGKLNLGHLLVKRIQLIGSTLRSQPIEVRSRLTDSLKTHVLPEITSGRIKVHIDKVFSFDQVKEAHLYLEENKNKGKIVVKM